MLSVNHFFEAIDLRGVHWAASFIGTLLCIYLMQLTRHSPAGGAVKCMTVNGLRRVSLWLLALSLLWSIGYMDARPTWQPWPPDLAALLAFDIFLSSAIIGIYLKQREYREDKAAARLTS